MGQIGPHAPAMLILAAFSRHPAALDWARRRAADAWGPDRPGKPGVRFPRNRLLRADDGDGHRKVFFAFAPPFDPGRLADLKLQTNAWEEEYARAAGHAEPRPLNLDPGYLSLGKLVLASTKDFAHRIYLRDGIYAEVTLLLPPSSLGASPVHLRRLSPRRLSAVLSPQCRDFLHAGGRHDLARRRRGGSEHGRSAGRRPWLCAGWGRGWGLVDRPGPSQGPCTADAHRRRTGHLAGHRAAAGRGTDCLVGILADRRPPARLLPGQFDRARICPACCTSRASSGCCWPAAPC